MKRPYLRDIITNHKALMKLRAPSGEIVHYDTFAE